MTAFLNFCFSVGHYLAEGFLHKLCPCLDIRFAQIRNHLINKESVYQNSSCGRALLSYNSGRNQESKVQSFQIYLLVKLADGRMLIKNEKISS